MKVKENNDADVEMDLVPQKKSLVPNDALIKAWKQLPENIKEDECFKEFRAEPPRKKSRAEWVSNALPLMLLIYLLVPVLALLVTPETETSKYIESIGPKDTSSAWKFNEFIAKGAVIVTIETSFAPESECTNDCLTACFGNDCKEFPLLNASFRISERQIRFDIPAGTNKTNLTLVNTSERHVPVALYYKVLDRISLKIFSAIFVIGVLYFLIIFENVLKVHRTFAALYCSLMSIGFLAMFNDRPSFPQIIRWIDVETIMLLFSMMIIVSILTETGVFSYMAVVVYKFTRGNTWTLIHSLCILTTVISSLLDNVTTTLLIAPMAITLCEVMQLNPVPVLMLIVIHANIGGTVTPVGDPPNVIITSNPHVVTGGVSFVTFTVHMGVGVVLCVISTAIYLRIYYRDVEKLKGSEGKDFGKLLVKKEIMKWKSALDTVAVEEKLKKLRQLMQDKIESLEEELQKEDSETFERKLKMLQKWYPIKDKQLLIKSGTILFIVIALFLFESIPEFRRISLSWCALLGVFFLIIISGRNDMEKILAKIEWSTLMFFVAMFIIMESVDRLGLIHAIGEFTKDLIMAVPPAFQLPLAITIILWISGIVSAFVDSIPVTTMMVKVVVSIAKNPILALPLQPLIWALAFGPCLGGNGTLVGASANVVCAGIAQQRGYRIGFIDFMKLGFPIMTLTLIVTNGYLLIAHTLLTWH